MSAPNSLADEENVEAAARAIYECENRDGSWAGLTADAEDGHKIPGIIRRRFLDQARAAITAIIELNDQETP